MEMHNWQLHGNNIKEQTTDRRRDVVNLIGFVLIRRSQTKKSEYRTILSMRRTRMGKAMHGLEGQGHGHLSWVSQLGKSTGNLRGDESVLYLDLGSGYRKEYLYIFLKNH